jgi:GDP-4-dehydro-6-deoxy-D-mannose reductase
MRVLITGMAGFAGRHLAEYLLHHTEATVIGLSRTRMSASDSSRTLWRQADMTDKPALVEIVAEMRPDAIVHAAAQASVPASWGDPWATFEQNVRGQQNLFDAVLAAGLRPRILIISSTEVYGAPAVEDLPTRETHPLRPNNPYAVSKAAQDLMARQYVLSHGLDVIVARPFNHIGPRQRPTFVIPSLTQRIAEMEAGQRSHELHLGNMAAQRDFTDVRDIAAAYAALLERGGAGEIYNVCSGIPRSIQAMLDMLVGMSSVRPRQISDPKRFRPIDTPIMYGDSTRLREATGWTPRIPIEQTLADMLAEARQRVGAASRDKSAATSMAQHSS